MFGEWVRQGGRAQAEFARGFARLMGARPGGAFDPLAALSELAGPAGGARAAAWPAAPAQAPQAFLGWGAYKTSVGSGGRISIPEAEREALGIGEGDLVQVIVVPVARKGGGEVTR